MFNFFKKPNIKSIDINELDVLIGKVELIDIRESSEVAEGSIETAKHIPMGDLLETPSKYLTQDKTYYIFCRSGMRSAKTAEKLTEAGYDIINLKGGITGYRGKHHSKRI